MWCSIIAHEFRDEVHTVFCINYVVVCADFGWYSWVQEYSAIFATQKRHWNWPTHPWSEFNLHSTSLALFTCVKSIASIECPVVCVDAVCCFAGWWLHIDSRCVCREEECEWPHWISQFRKTVSLHRVYYVYLWFVTYTSMFLLVSLYYYNQPLEHQFGYGVESWCSGGGHSSVVKRRLLVRFPAASLSVQIWMGKRPVVF